MTLHLTPIGKHPMMSKRLMQMRVFSKTAGLFLISKAILIDWQQNSILRNNGFLFGSLALILNMRRLTQIRFKDYYNEY